MAEKHRRAALIEVLGSIRLKALMCDLAVQLDALPPAVAILPEGAGALAARVHRLRGAASMLAEDAIAEALQALEAAISSTAHPSDAKQALAVVERERQRLPPHISHPAQSADNQDPLP